MSLCIKGIGTAVPRHCIAQEDLAEVAGRLCGLNDKQRRMLPTLYRHAGVKKRHSVVLAGPSNKDAAGQSFYQSVVEGGPNGPSTAERMRAYAENATPLAAEACRRALSEAQVAPSEITHLVTVSCSGFAAPGVDVQLFHELGLSAGVSRTHVGFMGCHGALNGLRVARAYAEADPNARVLLCAIELCTLHHQYGWNPDQIVANALFADGSAAAVCVPAGDEHPSDESLSALSSASAIVPATEDLMSWRIGDNGFQMGLSAQVPDTIRSTLRSWVAGWLATEGVELDQVGQWAIHPGGPRILQACLEALELPPEAIAASKSVLAEFGNMSSPTILFILDRLRRQNAPGPWVLLAFGPGLTIEAALVAPGIRPIRAIPAGIPAIVGTSADA
jgi:prepilin-type processing-associated H-X9-DG protein